VKRLRTLTNGLLRENPVLVLVLGTCPTLAVSTQASNAIGMGLAATAVLVMSNIAISLLRNVIPDKVRIPCYIVLIAGFVTVVQMIVEAYAYSLYQALGIYLPLIVVNCIILGRAEMYANKNSVLNSLLDGVGMGAGFTLALLAMASIREIFGNGTWFGMSIPVLADNHVSVLTMAPGGFVIFGCLIALVNKISKGKAIKKTEFGCAGCPSAAACGKIAAGADTKPAGTGKAGCH
jgi:electron transport complex protein RnfE